MKKLLSVLLLSLSFCLLFSFSKCAYASASYDKDVYSYLAIGHDDAYGNTDVLALISYNARINHISVVRIPRDTYYNSGYYQNKINQIYPALINEGKTREEAYSLLTDAVSNTFGVRLRGYVAMSTGSFVNFVNQLGGVRLTVDSDFEYLQELSISGINLKLGENLLSGEEALKIIRHRSNYAGGDLARIDAQRLVFEGLFRTVFELVRGEGGRKFFSAARENTVSNFSLFDLIVMVVKHSSKFKTVEFLYFTLPGKAYKTESGLWYYQINKEGASSALGEYLDFSGVLDPEYKLAVSKEIYFDKDYKLKPYQYKIKQE